MRSPAAEGVWPQLVEHLAALTGFRDRDMLDATLATALRELLEPRAVTIWRAIAAPDPLAPQRWSLRVRLGDNAVVPGADSAFVDLDRLPPLAAVPERKRCLDEQVVIALPGRTLFPLASERGAVGVVEIETDGLLDSGAERMAGGVLRIVQNVQALLDYGERDALTGLLNRKTFDAHFLKAVQAGRASASEVADDLGERRAGAASPRWIGVSDIDHFKRVNDAHGHLIGDEVLLLLARLMSSTFRLHDRLYRFGGEEFVALLRCASEVDAAAAFERLRAAVERNLFPQVGHLTVSVGFTQVRAGDTPGAAFARADRAVYFAKANGRNRVVSHADLVENRLIAEEPVRVGEVELF